MKYAIDGSNVLLGLRIHKKPSIRLFSTLLLALKSRGDEFHLFFDNSVRPIMGQLGLSEDWERFNAALREEGIIPTFAPRADPHIEKFCNSHGAAVINFKDKMDSWDTIPSKIHRARVFRIKNTLQVSLMDDVNGRFVLRSPANAAFNFGSINFPDLILEQMVLEPSIAPDSSGAPAATEGTLLVLALDASGSMTENDSFDGRGKYEHLNDIIKKAIVRLKNSRISEGLYVAILRFENDVTPMICPATGTIFASIYDWDQHVKDFDYLSDITPGLTNIRLALQRAKELLQETVADSDSVSTLADSWRAAVILVTDGFHYVQHPDGTTETDKDVANAALDIHCGVEGLIGQKIDVGCVGIGKEVNVAMLANIASQCSPIQSRMAKNAGIERLLRDGRLFIKVDSSDQSFVEAIRSFIDVASGSI